jgi:aryl-alcohol dehydrogenase-like predicted oxidoreductase/uncharacterized glyoxalase superfamily protein PhnB
LRYKLLGRSGLRVSELCLGTMTFGEDWGWGASKEECAKIFNAYDEAGGNFIDTANYYTQGTSESIVGELIASAREKYVVATKYSLAMHKDDLNSGGNHRKNMVQSLEASLRRLNTDYVDLYWLHAWDFTTPVDEIMRALDDMIRAGKVLYVGVSDTPAWIVSQANTLASLRGWMPFIGLQVEYSLIQRTPERDLLPMAQSFGMGLTAWSPLGGGLLSGKYNETSGAAGGQRLSANSGRFNEKNRLIVEELSLIAKEIGCTTAQAALGWVRAQSRSIIPIIGSRKESQFRENLASLQYELNDDQLGRLNSVSRIELGFPHDFLASRSVKDVIFGQKTYGEMPMSFPAELKDWVAHAIVKVGETELMFTDSSGQPITTGDNVTICITTNDVEKSKQLFDSLQQGGRVNNPLEETPFSPAFGSVTDKFGVTFTIVTEVNN